MSRSGRLTGFLALLLTNLAIAVLLLEVLLQCVKLQAQYSQSPLLNRLYYYISPHISWEEYFVYQHTNVGEMVYVGIHRDHPTRGWAMKHSSNYTDEAGISYTTNAQGFRDLRDYNDQPDHYQVMIVGDSFTFGDEITDTDTWPYLLGLKDGRMNILNMGGTGYGTDQMLITLEEEIQKYHPDLVIAAYIGDNLYRSTLPFRDYKKPFFVLSDDKLSLQNIPVGSPQEVLMEIANRRYLPYSAIQTVNLLGFFVNDLTRIDEQSSCNRGCSKLNTAIFERMRELAFQKHSEFMLVYLPFGNEIKSSEGKDFGEVFFDNYIGGRSGYFLNPRKELVSATFVKSPGHYQRNETILVSDFVMDQIRKTNSWQCKIEKRC